MLCLQKLDSKEFYSIATLHNSTVPTSQKLDSKELYSIATLHNSTVPTSQKLDSKEFYSIATLHNSTVPTSQKFDSKEFYSIATLHSSTVPTSQKLGSKEFYSIATLHNSTVPTSQKYLDSIFSESSLDWNLIYVLPRLTTKDTQLRAFQYKILHNILYLTKSYFNLEILKAPCVHSANDMMRPHSIFFAVAFMSSKHGHN